MSIVARMVTSGTARQIVSLGHALNQSDRFGFRLITGAVGPDESDYLQTDDRLGDAISFIPSLGREIRVRADFRALLDVTSEIRRYRPHIVHTNTSKAGLVGRAAAVLARVPVIVHTYHGHLLHGYFSPRATRLLVGLERTLSLKTDRLIAVGTQVREDLLTSGIGKSEQFRVVAPGVEPPTTWRAQDARMALGIPPHWTTISFVGRLVPIKRIDRLIDSYREVARHRENTCLVIAGGGELATNTAEAVRSFGGRVRMLGWIDDVGKVYAATDIAVITSDNEGMPVSLVEAAMCGVPSVTTDVGASAEVVCDGRTGIVCSPSVTDVATALGRLCDDVELRRSMGAAAKIHAFECFSEQAFIQNMIALYEEALVQEGQRSSWWNTRR